MPQGLWGQGKWEGGAEGRQVRFHPETCWVLHAVLHCTWPAFLSENTKYKEGFVSLKDKLEDHFWTTVQKPGPTDCPYAPMWAGNGEEKMVTWPKARAPSPAVLVCKLWGLQDGTFSCQYPVVFPGAERQRLLVETLALAQASLGKVRSGWAIAAERDSAGAADRNHPCPWLAPAWPGPCYPAGMSDLKPGAGGAGNLLAPHGLLQEKSERCKVIGFWICLSLLIYVGVVLRSTFNENRGC